MTSHYNNNDRRGKKMSRSENRRVFRKDDGLAAIRAALNDDNELVLESPLRRIRRRSAAPSHVINGTLMSAENVYETYIVIEYENTPLEILWDTNLSKKPDIFGIASSAPPDEAFELDLEGTFEIRLDIDTLHGREILAIKTIAKGDEIIYTETTELTIAARVRIRVERDHFSQVMDDEGLECDLYSAYLLIPFEGRQIQILWETNTSGAVNFFGYEPRQYPKARAFEFEPEEVFTIVLTRTTKATATEHVINKLLVRGEILFDRAN